MAIPFNLPSDEDTDDIHRRIDQLLFDIFHIIRQLLFTERQRINTQREERPSPQEEQRVSNSNLPDVVPLPLTRKPPVAPRRNRHKNRRERRLRPLMVPPTPNPITYASPSWFNVGVELRHYSDDITLNFMTDLRVKKNRTELKASSLLSLLVPAPISGSIWTTVIIIVGWRILARNR